ncbi:MAG: nuclear transport factor 2 family protein [Gammaproteobacteria bacterium]|nr:nuclear transport factor 2 family protein [Gammaproteobacteria bacterium]
MPHALMPLLRASIAAGLLAAAGTGLAADPPLEQRLQRLEDREEIRNLLLEYGRALDQRDFAAFADLFAETEGEWVGGLGTAKGRDAIRELMETTIGSGLGNAPPSSFHLFTNERIDVDGDRAEGVTKWVFVMQGASGDSAPEWVYLGHYDDTFIRENGRWRFLRREAFTDLPVQEASE